MNMIEYAEVANAPHIFKVLAYYERGGCHVCELMPDGPAVMVDLIVDGTLGDDVTPQDLIGKEVSVEYTHGYLWIANNVKIVDDGSRDAKAA